MTVGEGEQVQLELELDWSAAAALDAKIANQFIVQLGAPATGGAPDGVYLIIGEVTPPLIISNTAEGRKAQAESYGGRLPVRAHGRYYLTRARLEELRKVLDRIAAQYDEVSGGGQPS